VSPDKEIQKPSYKFTPASLPSKALSLHEKAKEHLNELRKKKENAQKQKEK
jgi:hypothetical protein